MQKLLLIVSLVATAFLLLFAFSVGLARSERLECERWKATAGQLSDDQMVEWLNSLQDWQVEQCNYHNITL